MKYRLYLDIPKVGARRPKMSWLPEQVMVIANELYLSTNTIRTLYVWYQGEETEGRLWPDHSEWMGIEYNVFRRPYRPLSEMIMLE